MAAQKPPDAAPQPGRSRLRAKLRVRWTRVAALALVVLGAVGAMGHFLGGVAGWVEFFHLTGKVLGDDKPPPEVSSSGMAAKAAALSVVVLPFLNEGSADDAWFADSLSGDIAIELSRVSGSSVIGRDTASSYRGRQIDPRQIARELNVRYVLLGSVRRDGDRVRVETRLVDGESGIQRWGERFDLDRGRLSEVVADIALRLARSVGVELYRSAGDAAARLPPAAARADDLAMRGLAVYFRGASPEGFREALALFEQAVAADPRSIRGWGGVSLINFLQFVYGWADDRERARRRVEEAAAKLSQLDSRDFFAILSLANAASLNRDWEGLLAIADAMIERFPGHPTGYSYRAIALMYLGRFADMLGPNERALVLSPLETQTAVRQWQRAFAFYSLGRYAEASDWARRAATSNPRLLGAPTLAAALLRDGKREQATQILADYLKREPEFSAARIQSLLRSDRPDFVAMRQRLIDDLREIGLP